MTDPRPAKEGIPHLIRTLLTDENWSAARLAREMGVAPSTITRILNPNSKFTPSTQTIEKLFKVVKDYRVDLVNENLALLGEKVDRETNSDWIPVHGYVQAGRWVTNYELRDQLRPNGVLRDPALPEGRLEVFEVTDDATDLAFPAGTLLVVQTDKEFPTYVGDIVVIRRRVDSYLDSVFETALWEVTGPEGPNNLNPRAGAEKADALPTLKNYNLLTSRDQRIGVVVASYRRFSRRFDRPATIMNA